MKEYITRYLNENISFKVGRTGAKAIMNR